MYNFEALMKIIHSASYPIEFGALSSSSFPAILEKDYASAKKVILVDENTHDYCLEYLLTHFEALKDAEIMLLPSGEENKVMEVCFQVWEALSEYKISRRDLIINLGGGLVSDMGGFIAALFKRGVNFIHIPTSLLAMVDASVGGKTGIDLGKYKNQIGVFADPLAIFVDPGFLTTLQDEEKLNGMAEMLKHGLIADSGHWNKLQNVSPLEMPLELIYDSVQIKNTIVSSDPRESGERKKLNFGHTFGHAFEGFLLGSENQVAHGHAVALGMLCEAYLSVEKGLLPTSDFLEIQACIRKNFPLLAFQEEDYPAIYELMLQDKKNHKSSVQCVLLKNIGEAVIDQPLSFTDVELGLNFLLRLVREK
ncbi:MAG: aroB [Crocinitomicaceae bacterium]|jgi:3-dehydroquinate synthase|nr:aroB [Crocinitomicaceae bacterium]